jgi:uncharacterized protein YbaR (Trm112 family)
MGIAVDPKLLEILVCPLTKTPLAYDRENDRLISKATGLAYPIVKGVPIMLVDEAEIVDEEKASEFKNLFKQETK